MKKLKKVYTIKLKSHDILVIKSLIKLWKSSAKFFNIELNGPIIMPIKKSKYIVLRSPHVNKKSREVFNFVQYKAFITVSTLNPDDTKNFIKILTKYLVAGVSFKLTKLI